MADKELPQTQKKNIEEGKFGFFEGGPQIEVRKMEGFSPPPGMEDFSFMQSQRPLLPAWEPRTDPS